MTMRKWHLDHGFIQSEYDPCAFHKTKGDSCLTILFYVDDVLAFLWGDEGESLIGSHVAEFGGDFNWTYFGENLLMIPDPSFGIIPDPGSRIPHPAYLPSDRSPRHTLLQ